MATLDAFLKDEAGTTAIEYALIAGGIFMVIILAVGSIGTSLNDVFNQVAAGFPN